MLLVLLVLVWLSVMVWLLLMDMIEVCYGDIGWCMVVLGDWVMFWFDEGVFFWGKLLLFFWLMVVSMWLFGLSEFVVCLLYLFCGVLIVVLVWCFV